MTFPTLIMHDLPKRWASHVRYRMSASTLEPLTLNSILDSLSDAQRAEWQTLPLGYASERGGLPLREAIASDYPGLTADNIVVFAGAQEAAFCALYALLGNDGLAKVNVEGSPIVTAVEPGFEPLIAVPKALGATVVTTALQSSPSGWQFPVEEFCQSIDKYAALTILNFPHNPTGALITAEQQAAVVSTVANHGSWLYSDEVFRGLEYNPSDCLPPAASLYERAVSLGSIAKPYGLGGVRVGWLASQNNHFLERVVTIKQSLSICTGYIDEWLAAAVLQQKTQWLEKNRRVMADHTDFIRRTLDDLDGSLQWIPPQAGIIAYPKLLHVNSSDKFAEQLVKETGVLIFPSSSFVGGLPEHFRLGFGLADFKKSWPLFCDFLQTQNA